MTTGDDIAAIVLAAGSSRRFGAENKLLALVDGVPLVERVITAIEGAGVRTITIVTGHQADRVRACVATAGRRIVHNTSHDAGIGRSIAAGIGSLEPTVSGVLIAQGDMPALTPDLVGRLITEFRGAGCDAIVCPLLADGRQGNPVIWPRRLFAALARLDGDRGGKALIEAEGDAVVRVPLAGPGAEIDIDTPAELAAYLASGSSQPR